ncbi:MAG: formiminotransferase-cyclodeaminase, partial [Actinophytocola sp.]|nr:formiminotransferase-cyclodeaminase [Actinophytocola sp.]
MTMNSSYGDMGLDDFLRALAAREPAPGGGAVAGVAIAMSAGLVAMAARFSESTLDGSAAVAQRAEQLQRRAMTLADEDARAYRSVLEAYALRRDDDAEARRAAIRAALRTAADVPLQIAAAGNDVAAMAVRLVAQGNRNLEGDAY